MAPIRDLEYAFKVRTRDYVVQVRGCGSHPAPITDGPSDVTFYTCVPEELLDPEDDDPYKIARYAIAHVRKFLPPTISEADWEAFEEAVVEWVCEHRSAAALRDHAS